MSTPPTGTEEASKAKAPESGGGAAPLAPRPRLLARRPPPPGGLLTGCSAQKARRCAATVAATCDEVGAYGGRGSSKPKLSARMTAESTHRWKGALWAIGG